MFSLLTKHWLLQLKVPDDGDVSGGDVGCGRTLEVTAAQIFARLAENMKSRSREIAQDAFIRSSCKSDATAMRAGDEHFRSIRSSLFASHALASATKQHHSPPPQSAATNPSAAAASPLRSSPAPPRGRKGGSARSSGARTSGSCSGLKQFHSF